MKLYSKDLRIRVLAAVDRGMPRKEVTPSRHTSMTRLRARAPRGERVYGKVPRNRGKNTTLLGYFGHCDYPLDAQPS